jgi:effector-binding domain-containing protein
MVEIELVELPEQPTAALHDDVPMTELPAFFDRAFHTVAEALQAQGAAPAGPPFAHYRGRPGETVDVEGGFPVAAPIHHAGSVHPGVVPAGRYAQAVHVGDYDSLEQTYAAVEHWIDEHGLEAAEDMWEIYLSDPEHEPDPAAWRTRVLWPVR